MRKSFTIFLLLAIGVRAHAEKAADVPPSPSRLNTLILAKGLIAPVEGFQVIDGKFLKNPFNPIAPPPSPNSLPQLSERAKLDEIALKVAPSGAIEMGGEYLLLFGQKRFKVGDHLPIVFEGKNYDVEVVGIHSTSFSIRLNGIEITKPIKSSVTTKPITKP